MNSDSPVRTRLPADSSLPMKPLPASLPELSPKTISIWMPGLHEHEGTGLGDTGFLRVEGYFDELHLLTKIS